MSHSSDLDDDEDELITRNNIKKNDDIDDYDDMDIDGDGDIEGDDDDDDVAVCTPGNEQTGRWTRKEHEIFLEALKKYGREWKKVISITITVINNITIIFNIGC
jgi:SHAQKYF class myb-like DNA-binding protein